MNAVMISIRPEWCEKIASGKKTVEVRKTRPKLEPPFNCYIYCTDGNTLYKSNADGAIRCYRKKAHEAFCHHTIVNGKVVGEFVCDWIQGSYYPAAGLVAVSDEKQSCLTARQIIEYANGKKVYFWHVTDLVIYEKPKQLSEFQKACDHKEDCGSCRRFDRSKYDCIAGLTCPPQSWCYVEELV